MPRQEALLRLHKTLLARRAELREQLAGELASLRDFKSADSACDSADMAFEAGGDEMSSQLAVLDDRELRQVEQALARLQQGRYGICEGGGWNCQQKIPVARLNALPYTPFCINCERESETHPDGLSRLSTSNWGQIADAQAPMKDQRINLSELEMDLSGGRRG
jgi:DnaK suppressor protein